MSSRINFTALCIGISFSFVFFFHGTGEANSFPFRSINPGDQLPGVTVKNMRSQQDTTLDKFQGKPLLLVFIGADIPTKKERSIKALQVVQKLEPFVKEKGFTSLVIDVQGDDSGVINELISATAVTLPFYSDVDKSAYGGLGIFVMPSILLVAADGKIVEGMGYSSDLSKRLKGEIEVMLGEKTRAQVEEELRPVMVEKSAEEKGAKRYFNLGKTMLERGQPESAMKEFGKAIELEPDMGKAHIYLGCLQLDEGKVAEAKASLAKGMESEPDYLPGQICQARIKAKEGALDEAMDDISFLMMRHSRDSSLHYVLGTFLEEKSGVGEAGKEYRKAYELLLKKSHVK
ncbi:MAG: redoxin family protein [Proteobacteria bacterium]|nr:redoxin family protein [Pseudomonadota bacterium]MBU1738245.1 redoxin family protein [Pseudomonadota bacterium]